MARSDISRAQKSEIGNQRDRGGGRGVKLTVIVNKREAVKGKLATRIFLQADVIGMYKGTTGRLVD